MIRTSISSGYPFEDEYGYVRAVRVGDQIFVSGTTARAPHLDGDAFEQMTSAIATVTAALNEADAPLVARAHCWAFGASPPASTLVQVAALTPAAARVEIEVTAIIHD